MAVSCAAFVLSSCVSYKKVPYFQNADQTNLSASRGIHDARIMPKDVLSISVTTPDREISSQFNQLVYNTMQAGGSRSISSGSGSMMPYTVGTDGNINFPIIGKISVQGLTRRECEDKIAGLVKPYLSSDINPVVVVEFQSYTVTVLGEVSRPGAFNVNSEKYSILQALGAAGDMTIYCMRDNVLLIREDAKGEKTTHRLDLNDANVINSPYFYLQQNDVVYVQPNKAKAKNSDIGSSTSLWFSATSILISLTSLMYNILKK
jgi:polysaccharide export outer membrane protein